MPEIANVMFKWDTELGARNKEPHGDTLVRIPTHAQTHTDVHTRHTIVTPAQCF